MSKHANKALILVFCVVLFVMFLGFLYAYVFTTNHEANNFEDAVTASSAKNLPFYSELVGVSKRVEALLGWHDVKLYTDSGVIEITDGHYTNVLPKIDMSEHVAAVTSLRDYVEAQDIAFLYAQAPAKISSQDPESGTLDFTVQNAKELMASLRANGVDVLDLNAEMEKIDPSASYHHSLYYHLDHHWRVETALWAAGVLSQYCNEHYGSTIDLSLFDPDQYSYDVRKGIFLGTHGNSLTEALVQPEDFTIVRPTFDTYVSFSFPEIDYYATGDDSVLFNMDVLDSYAYDIYLCGTQPLKSVYNYLADNGFRVLFINDSYNVSCGYFFSFGVMETIMFDPRYNKDSVRNLIDEECPDAVIMLCFSGNLVPTNQSSATDLFNLE
ncbi:MAG TPA: hypothetical protein PK537_11705 [Candidatus Limiplasma sp.]|mgnify:CR=1 FL=1|nr:hypothetical protein [Candidatus Limiplasma sp.]